MRRKFSTFLLSGLLTGMIVLIGCAPATPTAVNPTEKPPATAIPEAHTPTSSATPLFTEIPTSTPTSTAVPTSTDTQTPAPSPTPNMVLPGNYYIGKCADIHPEHGVKEKFCINDILVDSLRHMRFDVSYTASNVADPPGYILKPSEKDNFHVYLMDNLGNRYDHAAGGGAAYRDTHLENEVPHPGWFEFGSPPVGALSFDFHNDDNHMIIQGIQLIPGYGYVKYEKLALDQFPLVLEYDQDKWTPTKAQDGTSMLTHTQMPACTIQPKQPGQPTGELKSQSKVGSITYDIYGNYDQNQNLYFREYVYVSGLSGMDPNIKPFFYVTIPAENSSVCVAAVSDVLARLRLPTP